jgi:hypothetical protein
MRKLVLILSAMALVSCSNESKMKSEIKTYLNKNAKDPKSYEFVELKIIDTVTDGDLIQRNIENLESELSFNMERIEKRQNKYDGYLKDGLPVSSLNNIKKEVDSLKLAMPNIENKILNLKKQISNKDILGYVATHKFRIKNGFGALDLSEMFVEFDKDYKLLEMDKDLNFSVFNQKK